MKVEYTGRQTTVRKHLRTQAEEGLSQISKLVGRAASAHVILTENKYRKIAEVEVVSRGHSLVGTCKATDMETALHDALAKVEKQAVRANQKFTTLKRHPKEDKNQTNVSAGEREEIAAPLKKTAMRKPPAKIIRKPASVVVNHARKPVVEPHVVRSIDSTALIPMTFEEAVKEAATRDRDVFVFRDGGGQVMVLHRQRSGLVELIEVP